jgi:hypothetical protein
MGPGPMAADGVVLRWISISGCHIDSDAGVTAIRADLPSAFRTYFARRIGFIRKAGI